MEVVAKSEGEAESTPAVLSRGRRGPQKGLGDSTSSQAAPSSWPGDSVADTCSVPPASYSLTDHLQREASAPALPRFNKITLYLQITLPSPPPPSKTSCFTPTPVLLRIFLVRHLRSLPIRCPMYNQTFSVGFFFLYIYIYINGGDISHRRRTRPCDGSCLYIARRLWHATFSQSFVAR